MTNESRVQRQLSFSQRVKAEICEKRPKSHCCRLSELYAVLLFAHTFNRREARIITKSAAFARRIPFLFGALSLQDKLTARQGSDKFTFSLEDKDAIFALFSQFGLDYERYLYPTIHANVIEKPCCKTAFLRGAILAAAFFVDPQKDFRLELLASGSRLARQMTSFLLDFGLSPKETRRGGQHLLYFRDSDAIEELLAILGAGNAQMEIINAKILRSVSNKANRRANCDVANAMKSYSNAALQIAAIERIQATRGLSCLEPRLRCAAELRLQHPDLSLQELCDVSKEPISKSGLYFRLKKIMELDKEG